MELNTSFYSVEQADLGNGLTVLDKIVSSQINDGDLPTNEEWDLSLAPWIIGKGCEWFDLSYIIEYFPGAVQTPTVERVGKCFDDNNGTGFPFWFGIGGSQSIRLGWQYKNAYAVQNVPVSAQRNNNKPIVNFKYNELIYYWTVYIGGTERTLQYVENNWNTLITNSSFLTGFRNRFYYRTAIGQSRQAQTVTVESLCKPLYIDDTDMPTSCGYNIDFLDYTFPVLGGINQYTTDTRLYPLTQTRSAAFTSQYDISRINFFPVPSNDNWSFSGSWNRDGQYLMCKRDLSTFTDFTDFKDWLCKQAAYLGTYFTFDITTAQTADLSQAATNPNVYLGEIDENGITTGNYLQGTQISDSDQSQWVDPWSSSPWHGFDIDPTPWDTDQTSIISSATGDPSYGTREYLMSANALNELVRVLNELKIGEIEGDVAEGYCERAFGSSDPMAAIISVIKYPFDMIYNWLGESSREVVHGSNVGSWFYIANAQIAVDTSGSTPPPYTIGLTSAHEIYEISWASSSIWDYGFAKIPYFSKYKSFLDYEPYCSAALYLPFCGSIRIDPEVYVGHDVAVKYIVSPLDGTVKAYILRDNLVIDTLTGNAGTSIEINTSDDLAKANTVNQLNATIQSQKMHVVKSLASFASTAGLGVATGGASLAVNAFMGAAKGGALGGVLEAAQHDLSIGQSQYQINTTATPFKQLQSGGGYLSAADEYAIRLVAYRPEPLPGYSFDDWRDYGAVTGFACLEIGVLSGFTGYTECAQVIADGIQCTSREKNMIIKLLQAGVYL